MFSELIDQYKKELGEFVTTVSEDTKSALTSAKETIQRQLQESDDEGYSDEEREGRGLPEWEELRDVLKATEDELGPGFDNFYDTVDMQVHDLDTLRQRHLELYKEFVPDRMTDEEFCCRALYFQHLERRAQLLAGTAPAIEEEELSWGDDDDEEEEEDASWGDESPSRAPNSKPVGSGATDAKKGPQQDAGDLESLREIIKKLKEENLELQARNEKLEAENRTLREEAQKKRPTTKETNLLSAQDTAIPESKSASHEPKSQPPTVAPGQPKGGVGTDSSVGGAQEGPVSSKRGTSKQWEAAASQDDGWDGWE